jgi:hypothetical protein
LQIESIPARIKAAKYDFDMKDEFFKTYFVKLANIIGHIINILTTFLNFLRFAFLNLFDLGLNILDILYPLVTRSFFRLAMVYELIIRILLV